MCKDVDACSDMCMDVAIDMQQANPNIATESGIVPLRIAIDRDLPAAGAITKGRK